MDKREFLRCNVNLDVRYRILESLESYKNTTSEDMSEKGVRVNLPEYVEPETRLELTIRLPGELRPITAIGRVAWVKKDPIGSFFTTGVHLVHIRKSDRERFYKYAFF